MNIHLLNFPSQIDGAVTKILTDRGHSAMALSYEDLFIYTKKEITLSMLLVYEDVVTEGTLSLYWQIIERFPNSTIWLVSPSYRPEDVRTAILGGYSNYILWSPDMKDFIAAVDGLKPQDTLPDYYIKKRIDKYHMIDYPLDQQLLADRLLTALILQQTTANHYLPVLYRLSDLKDCFYSICVIKLCLPLNLYFREDYENVLSIISTQFQLHIDFVENTLSPSFSLLRYTHRDEIICLFYGKSNFQNEIFQFLSRLSERVQQTQGISLLFRYSPLYSQLMDTRSYYNSIRHNLSHGQINSQFCIPRSEENLTYISYSKSTDEYIKQNMFLAISNNNFDLISKVLIDAIDRFQEQNTSLSFVKSILLQTLIRFAQETNFYLIVNEDFIEHTLAQAIQRIPLFSFLKELLHLLQDIYFDAKQIYSNDDSNRLNLAMQYIDKNYYRNITLQSISDHLALTPNYFCGWFKKTTGEKFSDVIIRYRIDAAKHMLTHSDKKIRDIAEEVGYAETVSFNRIFKKATGVTPSEYRENYINSKS